MQLAKLLRRAAIEGAAAAFDDHPSLPAYLRFYDWLFSSLSDAEPASGKILATFYFNRPAFLGIANSDALLSGYIPADVSGAYTPVINSGYAQSYRIYTGGGTLLGQGRIQTSAEYAANTYPGHDLVFDNRIWYVGSYILVNSFALGLDFPQNSQVW